MVEQADEADGGRRPDDGRPDPVDQAGGAVGDGRDEGGRHRRTHLTGSLQPMAGGRGLLVRFARTVVLVAHGPAPEEDDVVGELVDVVRCLDAGDPDDLVPHLSALLAGDRPGGVPAVCIVAGVASGTVVIAHGAVAVTVSAADQEASIPAGTPGTWTTRLVRDLESVAAGFPGAVAGPGGHLLDLVDGAVPADGFTLVAVAVADPGRAGDEREPVDDLVPPPSVSPDQDGHGDLPLPPVAVPVVEDDGNDHDVPAPDPATSMPPPPPPSPVDEAAHAAILAAPTPEADLLAPPAPAPPPPPAPDPEAELPPLPSGPIPIAPGGPPDSPTPTRAAPATAEVQGVLCSRSHFNDPRARYCTTCGVGMLQASVLAVQGPRPPLGALVFDDGTEVPLAGDVVLGRSPGADPRVGEGTAVGVVPPGDPAALSRVHAEVRLDGWDVLLVDATSTNGTHRWDDASGRWTRLRPGDPVVLTDGDRVAFGRTTARFRGATRTG